MGCCNCGGDSFGHKCSACGASRDTSALRVFVGQLCREGAGWMCNRILSTLCPDLQPLYIEPHTNAKNGHGKGCCWVYVSSLHEVVYIVSRLHRRTFITVDPQTSAVGFVLFPSRAGEQDIQNTFERVHNELPTKVQWLLHRACVTAEVPKSLEEDVKRHKENPIFCLRRQAAEAGLPVPPSHTTNKSKKQQQQQMLLQQQQQQQQQNKPFSSSTNLPKTDLSSVMGKFKEFVPKSAQQQQQNQNQTSSSSGAGNININNNNNTSTGYDDFVPITADDQNININGYYESSNKNSPYASAMSSTMSFADAQRQASLTEGTFGTSPSQQQQQQSTANNNNNRNNNSQDDDEEEEEESRWNRAAEELARN